MEYEGQKVDKWVDKYSIVTIGWPRPPQQTNLQQLPSSCGSIDILDEKTLKDHILSSKFSPPKPRQLYKGFSKKIKEK